MAGWRRGLIAIAVAGAAVAAVTGAAGSAGASRRGDAPAKTTGVPVPVTSVPGPTATATPSTVPTLGGPTTALPNVGISTLAPTTLPPVAAPPEFTVAPHRTIETDIGRGPQFVPTVILPPAAKHDWLLIGDYRSNPGAVTQVVVYSAPAADPAEWTQLAFTGEDQPTSARAAVTTGDGAALIFGSADGTAGPSPAVWTLEGATLSEPQVVGPETPFGRVAAAAMAPDGTAFAIVQRYVIRQRVNFELGRRSPDGTWTFSELRLPAFDIGISGIAVSGTTIVLTGDGKGAESERGYRALAFTSTDGGATFALADTTTLAATDRSTSLGAVASGADGFFAAACLSGSGAQRQAIARSADGVTWSEYTFTGPEYVVPQYSAGCDEIAVDEEGGVWLGGFHSFDAVAYRVLDGAVDRVAVSYVEGDQPLFHTRRRMQLAVGGGTLALSTPQVGGPLTGFAAVSSTTNLDDPHQILPAGTAPPGHEVIWDLTVLNDLGNVVGLVTYPQVAHVGESTLYRRRVFPYTLSDVGQPAPAPSETPLNPDTGGGLEGVVTLAGGDVALASVADMVPGDVDGTVGDVVVSRRPPGGEWSPMEVVLGGPGGQLIRDVTVVGGLVVGVGDNLVTNPTTHVEEGRPFVLFGDGTAAFSRIDLDVGGSNLAEVYSVCAMPDSRALVIGYDWLTGEPFSALVDLDAGTVQINQISIRPTGAIPQRCVGAREGAYVEVAGSSFDDGSLLYATRDGITFESVGVLAEDDAMYRIRSGAAGIAIVGVTGPASEDAFVLFGPTIDSLQRVDVPGFVGAGVQVANDVVIADGTIYVIGTINDSPVVWPITFG